MRYRRITLIARVRSNTITEYSLIVAKKKVMAERRNKTQKKWKSTDVKTNVIGELLFCGDVRFTSGSGRLTFTLVLMSDARDNIMLNARISIRSEINFSFN